MDELVDHIRAHPFTEVEISIRDIQHDHMEQIKAAYESRGFKLSTHTVMDVNYSYAHGKTYRIVIKRDIAGTLEPFRRNMSFKVFQGLLKTDREVIHKERKHVVDLPKMRLRVSEETPQSPSELEKTLKLTRSDDKKIVFRFKTRSSVTVKDTPEYAIRVDMTQVSSDSTFIKALDGAIHHEVEVELIFKRELPAVPKEALEALMKEATSIQTLISPKKSPATKSKEIVVDPAVEITPSNWMLANRVGFVQWLYKTFTYDDDSKLFTSQRFARDFLQLQSPYRGLLLYHGLGVGKTCASIAAAEGFMRNHHKIIVMLPASLAPNYRLEIMKCAKTWNLVEGQNDDVAAILKNEFAVGAPVLKKLKGRAWLPYVPSGLSSYVKRANVPWGSLTADEQQNATMVMDAFMEKRMEFISFNGIKERQVDAMGDHAFDDAFVVMDEAHNFISRFVNGGKVAKKLYHKLMAARNMKIVLLSGTPVINHPYELAALINLVRGRMPVYEIPFLKKSVVPTQEELLVSLETSGYAPYIDNVYVTMERDKEKLHITLLPYGYAHAPDGNGIINVKWPKILADMVDDIHSYLMKEFKVGKMLVVKDEYALPTDKESFQELFLDETDPDNPRMKNVDLFMRRIMGTISYYRTAGEEYFPTVLPRMVHKIPMTSFQFARYIDIRTKERKMESRKGRPSTGVFGPKGTVYRAFSRMACNFTFPDGIKRPFPKDLRKELQKELSQNEEDAAADNAEETKKVDEKKVSKTYEEKLDAALKALAKGSSEYLVASQLRDMYSPKFETLLKDIDSSPGSCLLYSQFRTVEGLGIYRMVLEAAGYKEMDIERKGRNDWTIVNKEEVLKAEYNGKRFVVFNEDRDKTNVLMKIFNNQWSELPANIQEEVQSIPDNLYGLAAKVMMISQSGAEGISLRNVRRVMIMEPFWNMVRIDQVIGRAIRTRSHDELPLKDRNVQVFIYMATFTPQQLKQDFTLQRLDHSLSSDEHIMRVAEHKDSITKTFLELMKRASVDCLIHAKRNKTFTNGLQCYAFPVNMEDTKLAFAPTMTQEIDNLPKNKLIRTRKIRGRVVSKDGKKYVILDDHPGLYDYTAYVEAGTLVRV